MTKPFRLTPPKIRERDVMKAVEQVLLLRGYYPVRLQSGVAEWLGSKRINRVGDPGLPDWVGVHEKYPAVFVEVKRPGISLKLRETQMQKIWEMEMGYHVAVVVVDSPDALSQFLNEHEGKFQTGQQ